MAEIMGNFKQSLKKNKNVLKLSLKYPLPKNLTKNGCTPNNFKCLGTNIFILLCEYDGKSSICLSSIFIKGSI